MINAQTLAMMRNGVAGLRTTPCTINRGGNPVASVTCRIRPDREYAPVPGQPLTVAERWLIYLPPGQDVRVSDQITAQGCLYQVVIVEAPRTIEVSRMVTCYLLVDANGNSAIYPPNATVSVVHMDDTDVYTSRRVRLVQTAIDETFNQAGETVNGVLYDVPGSTYELGDKVTILSIDGHTGVPDPATYPVGEVALLSDPVAIVRVQLIGLAGGSGT